MRQVAQSAESAGDMETVSSPMQAVFDFFWTMLSERDRRCIGGLSLFRGGFTVEAALDVADVTPFLLAALRDRAFVQSATAGRYYLHELVRQYAWAWLQRDPARQQSRAAPRCVVRRPGGSVRDGYAGTATSGSGSNASRPRWTIFAWP